MTQCISKKKIYSEKIFRWIYLHMNFFIADVPFSIYILKNNCRTCNFTLYFASTISKTMCILKRGCLFHYAVYIFPFLFYTVTLNYFPMQHTLVSITMYPGSLLHLLYLLGDCYIMKNKDIKFTRISSFILNS